MTSEQEPKKPREWWIIPQESNNYLGYDYKPENGAIAALCVHVIEYDAVKDFLDTLHSELGDDSEAIEAKEKLLLDEIEMLKQSMTNMIGSVEKGVNQLNARETELLNLVRDLTNALKSCAEYIYLESKDSQSPYFNHGGNCMRLVAVEEKSAEALVKADATLKRLGVTE